jgi:hypothetical protein
MVGRLQHDERNITRLVLEAIMSRRTLTLLGTGLALALAACHTSTPTASVSALSYQFQSTGQRGTATAGTDCARVESTQSASRKAIAPEEISPDDPRRLLDMP